VNGVGFTFDFEEFGEFFFDQMILNPFTDYHQRFVLFCVLHILSNEYNLENHWLNKMKSGE
jgi:hypothetical protein